MNVKIALIAASLALVACGSSADDGSSASSPAATVPPSEVTGNEPAPCPAASAAPPPSADAGAPKKTPSPVEACDASYSCGHVNPDGSYYDYDSWLHTDGVHCFFGSYVLEADGRVMDGATLYGHWTGDARIFSITEEKYAGGTSCTQQAPK